MKIFHTIVISAAITLAAIFSACGQKQKTAGDELPLLAVSIEPQRWLLDQIVGNRAEVIAFLPGDANPENFDPPMSALKDASDAKIYMQMGHLPWETGLIERIRQSNKDITVVDTSLGIDFITGTHGHDHDHGTGEGHDHGDEEIDPHTWSSVRNAKIIAANMAAAVAEADTANAVYYYTNLGALQARLDSLDRYITKTLAPYSGKSILVWHPSLSYFARDYGLEQTSIGMENKESSVSGLKSRLDKAAAGGSRVFFVQPQMDGERSAQIAAQTGARMSVIHPLAYDFAGEMRALADAIADTTATVTQ